MKKLGFGICFSSIFFLIGCCCQVCDEGTCHDVDTASQLEESTSLIAGQWPEMDWWEMFDDAQLAEYVQVALKESPNLKSAKHRIDQAQQEAYVVRKNFRTA